MKAVKVLFICHLAALLFGLAGMLIALPHPELWSFSPLLISVFSFGINYAGSLHILFGAATVLLFGLRIVGVRRTLIFFAASTLISLSIELIGTSTGFPFGPYSYNTFLGFKILGHVPYSIPLSWFYMGFSAYILAHLLLTRRRGGTESQRGSGLWAVLLGAYLLTVWDLTLDPAMASERLPLHFWQWGVQGAYFGMPVQNLVGWSVTGLLYMGVSRLLWRSDLEERRLLDVAWLPFGVYTANTLFAIVLDLSVGLWLPPLLGLFLGIVPATLVLRRRGGDEPGASGSGRAVQEATAPALAQVQVQPSHGSRGLVERSLQSITRLVMRGGAAFLLWRRGLRIAIEGGEHLPARGPVIVAARHYHHLYDGCLLLGVVPRPVHILVALDWARTRWQRLLMERLCALAGWPVMLRPERLRLGAASAAASAYRTSEVTPYLRRAWRQAVDVLRRGDLLVVFPEGYPVVDPLPSPRQPTEPLLPFRPGFARLVELAERESGASIPVLPAGIVWRATRPPCLTLRLGTPLFRRLYADTAQFIAAVESCVRLLSGLDQDQALTRLPGKEVLHS
ncbi:MAG: carotenoid biosynthesis protein [Thermogemmatispora sp.]|uniref:carotenoid biosynthesis protein n=3 Tax=Thermogemmatispora sp. TaxID=1968838 RepID=UPI001D90FCAC|nr:carotenoid biosynthesis protein [Thermogemmatispora sp.]MBX5449013.1 carotenoid biosynthesis protein [Thermogemmatispora sp.]